MFLGIFSSLIPYLIAGGFSLIYLLVALAGPPNREESPEELQLKTSASRKISLEVTELENRKHEDAFHYFDHLISVDKTIASCLTSNYYNALSPPRRPAELRRGTILQTIPASGIYAELFFRPPPASQA